MSGTCNVFVFICWSPETMGRGFTAYHSLLRPSVTLL